MYLISIKPCFQETNGSRCSLCFHIFWSHYLLAQVHNMKSPTLNIYQYFICFCQVAQEFLYAFLGESQYLLIYMSRLVYVIGQFANQPVSLQTNRLPLRRPKRSSFLGARASARARRGMQGPCARATKQGARASEFPKTLNHVFSSILLRVQFH